ncbi:MAG: cyclic nucleotide-binding domain-containing protein [Deltaproteobacteria bacterium]|nr:cyclic nucleotide-binding domain-containing protein [Deltaproteobacteria bacterium]
MFKELAPDAIELIAAIAREESHRTGTMVFREGDVGDRLYVILDGRVRISRQVSGMGEEALAILGPGDAFGEMALVDDYPRSADAVVHESCRVLVLDREAVEELMFLHKDLAYEILWSFVRTLANRLRETNDKMTFLAVSGKFG